LFDDSDSLVRAEAVRAYRIRKEVDKLQSIAQLARVKNSRIRHEVYRAMVELMTEENHKRFSFLNSV